MKRHLQLRIMPAAAVVAPLATLLLLACGPKPPPPPPVRVALPGFSITLPAGKVKSSSQDPRSGKHSVELPGPGTYAGDHPEISDRELEVSWMPRAMSESVWRTQILPMVIRTFARTERESKLLHQEKLDETRWMYVIGESEPAGFGVVNCDPQFSVLLSYARYADVELQTQATREILQSVTCAVTDANVQRVNAATSLPAKLGSVPSGQFQIFRSLDGEVLKLSVGDSAALDDPATSRALFQSALETFLGTSAANLSFEQLRTISSDDRPTTLMRGITSQPKGRYYMATIGCPPGNLTVISFWTAPDADDSRAHDRLSQVGCPGESSTPSRTFQSLVEEACKQGNSDACARQAGTGNSTVH